MTDSSNSEQVGGATVAKKPWYKKWWGILLIGFGVLVVLSAIFGDPEKNGASSQSSAESVAVAANEAGPAPEAAPKNAPEMSLAEFNQIKSGMSRAQVVAIVGSDGTVASESDMAGYNTIMLTWEGEGSYGANANVMLQNNKVVNKAQFGLE